MADEFRTQDTPLSGRVSYMLSLPSALWYIAEVSDLLADMTFDYNWEQVGTVTVDEATQAAIAMYGSFQPMIGQIFPYLTAEPPSNALACDGASYNREDYPSLYAVLDDAFVDDADTFHVPDLRGFTVIGASTTYPMGTTGGEATHVLTEAEMPTHHHAYDPVVVIDVDLEDLGLPQGNAAQIVPLVTENTYAAGGDEPHNNLPPYVALKYCVIAQ